MTEVNLNICNLCLFFVCENFRCQVTSSRKIGGPPRPVTESPYSSIDILHYVSYVVLSLVVATGASDSLVS